MTITTKTAASLAAWAALAAALGEVPAAQPPRPDPGAVDQIVRDALRAWQVPGAALAIVQGDRVVYLKAFGEADRVTKAPVTPDTVFAIGSCTKSFTSAALALLVDEGKLDRDGPV